MAKSTTKVLFKTWYFGHTGWSRFQTDECTTLNRHLIQIDVKFQYSIFIFLNKRFSRIYLNKVPIVFVQQFILSIPDYCHINFQWFSHFPIIIPIFHGEFWVLPAEMAVAFLCVFSCSRGWPSVLFCWCSIDLPMIFFFDSPLYTDPHEHFNSYFPG